MKKVIISVIVAILFANCVSVEGEGGNSTIKGNVFVVDYAVGGTVLDTFPAVDEDVYITYGSGEFSDDDVSTNAYGEYEITGLRKGNYALFAYSSDPYGDGVKVPMKVVAEITKRNEEVQAPDIYIYNPDNGISSLKGVVKGEVYYNDESYFSETILLADEDVFLKAKGGTEVFDVKSNEKGEFFFNELWPGEYELYFYEKSDEAGEVDVPKIVPVEIKKAGQTVDVGEVLLNKTEEGTCIIYGKVMVHNYSANDEGILVPKNPEDNYYADAEEVHIRRVGSVNEIDQVRTNVDGSYYFKRLRLGTYVIWAYRKAAEGDIVTITDELIPVTKTIDLKIPGSTIKVDDLIIIK